MSLRLAWSTEQVSGQAPKLQGNLVLKNKNKSKKTPYILTCDVHSVPWLNLVYQIIMGKKNNSVRCLPSRHVFRRFLKFDLKEARENLKQKKYCVKQSQKNHNSV